ncbi:MAG: TonB-dependent receptor [Acidobacteria bacterium]|nr:TonB-dependent receptor [Acidobacteriota bacterium]
MAQTFGAFTGQVTDSTGAAISGASITVTNTATNAVRNAVSNDAGLYDFPSLAPGVYHVKVEKPGFKSATSNNVQVQVQQTVRLDFSLTVGQVSESIEVLASAAQLQTENSTVGTVIENKRIVELPLNGRNYLQLVSLSPNVTTASPSAGQAGSRQGGDRASQSIAVAGQRTMFNHFTLDGVENTDPNFNTYVILPSIDAIQEYKIQTGVYPAEFGREATQINVLTRSGGNQFHGTAFEFLRNDKLDAKNYAFTTARPPKDPFKWNQYGFTFGGPVWIPKVFNGHDKLFFMGNYESFRQRRSVQSVYTVPTLAMQGGDFTAVANTIYDPATRAKANGVVTASAFPGQIIPKARFDPISLKLLEFYPASNLTTSRLSNNFQESQGRPINKDQFVLRMDFVESDKSSWFGRYSWGDENQLSEGLHLDGTKILTNVEQYVGSNTRVLSPAVVTETRFGYTRFYNSIGRNLAFTRNVVKELGIPGLNPGDPVVWGIPNVTLINYSSIGDDTEGPYENKNNSLQFLNNTSWTHGKHTFRFGGEIRREQFNQVGNQFARGQWTFDLSATQNPQTKTGGDSFAGFLLGQLYQAEAAVSIASAQFRSTSFSLYFDDTWKVTPKLTLSLGLRYENTPPWEDQTGKLFSVYIPYMDSTPQVADKSRYPSFIRQGSGTDPYSGVSIRWPNINVLWDGRLGNRLVARDNNDFAPRLGIAYTPNNKWVVRTGYGILYNQDTGNPRFDMSRNLSGRVRFNPTDPDFPNLTWSSALAGFAGANAQVATPYAFANKYERRTPYAMMYLFNVQRELTDSVVVEAGYLGSVSHHLESLRAVNESLPGTVGSVNSRAPYPNFGRIQLVDNGANANYNSMSLKVTKRYTKGLTLLASYTWAKSIDDASGIRVQDGDTLFPQNSYCVECERGVSAFDTRHRFITSGLWDIPVGRGRAMDVKNPVLNAIIGGWQIGSILMVQSGFPLTPTIGGTDRSGTGSAFDRPNATGLSPYVSNPSPAQWFNIAAFALQPAGTLGNAGRESIVGPGMFTWDFSTHKDFQIHEGHRIEFRWEAFNAANHPVWGTPNSNANSSASFGTITGTRINMRQMQCALKYVF